MWHRNFEPGIQQMLANKLEELKRQERDDMAKKKREFLEYQNFLAKETCDGDRDFDQHKDCPICYKIMVEPIRLPCSHYFCISCLNVAYEKQQDNDKKCPLCRQTQKDYAFTPEDMDKAKQNEIRESNPKEFETRRKMLREANLLVCETARVGLLIGNTFNSKKDEWVAHVKLSKCYEAKYELKKIATACSFHLNSFDEGKKAWRLDFNKKQNRFEFDPGYVETEHPEFDEETIVYMKCVLTEGALHKQDRIIKTQHRLNFEKGGYFREFLIDFDREWLEKHGAIKSLNEVKDLLPAIKTPKKTPSKTPAKIKTIKQPVLPATTRRQKSNVPMYNGRTEIREKK